MKLDLSNISNPWISEVLAENLIKNCDYFIQRANSQITEIVTDIEVLIDQMGAQQASSSDQGDRLANRLAQQEQNLAEWTAARAELKKQGCPEPKTIPAKRKTDLAKLVKAKKAS